MNSPSLSRLLFLCLTLALFGAGAISPSPSYAQARFEFLSPPSTTSNRIYRVDVRTGAMGVCWFNGTHTECMSGTGLAGAQTTGRYTLQRSESASEKGVFRLDLNTGSVSNCWVKQGSLVCTFPVR